MSDYEDDETRWLDDLLWRGARVVLWVAGAWAVVAFWAWVWGLVA